MPPTVRPSPLTAVGALAMTPRPTKPRAEETVWVRGPATVIDPDRPVPLVSYGDPCVHHKLVVKALQDAGKDWEVVFTGSSMNSLNGAVAAGLGVLAITRRRAQQTGMNAWEDGPLPKLPNLYRGVYVREGGAAD